MNTCSQPRCGRNSYSSSSMRSGRDEWSMNNFALAMAYVPVQRFQNVYELDAALQHGTIFPELNKPFTGWKGGRPC
ncbi:MAG: spore coat associated protein CotJA [Eubacterium sp.]|jgi:hypothetical protein|nr:spore coat associated protein CotJA [Eubacterium sp.]